jgi:hypothetical protein
LLLLLFILFPVLAVIARATIGEAIGTVWGTQETSAFLARADLLLA